jgi:PIN domain nuclease of toxin-antitoxin system
LGRFPLKLLLDTHIWLWSVLDPNRLTRRVEKALKDPANELWLSPVSIAELIVLLRKGRVKLPHDVAGWVTRTIEQLQISEAPLTIEVALAISSLNFRHGDPADQFLAATAKVLDLTLVTADERLLALPGIRVLTNR